MTVMAAGVCSATQLQYTQSPAGSNTVALGYPVPSPIDSLTPVAGFRSYASLHARHQQLDTDSANVAAVQIGSTTAGRPIWAYVLSDADGNTAEGSIVEAGMLQNGGIHAREWQTPEAVTSIFETLVSNETDQGLHQYLLENSKIVLIPVLNVDGFLQSQRYPDRAMWTKYAGDPSDWPRDGRMRRKNMRGVDENLATESDNLLGVDLNRNNNPFWASSNGSSGNNAALTYHGSGPGSEPEIQALQQAADLFASHQLRFYIDTHSFSKVYITPRTGNERRDDIALALAQQMVNATGNSYAVDPDPINAGMGTTDGHFAYNYQIPSYTLEVEPRNSSAEYGGFGSSHDGFILPASQIDRLRSEITRASLLGYYHQSGAPALIAAQAIRLSDDHEMAAQSWTPDSATHRAQARSEAGAWQIGESYRLILDFNKPMRVRDSGGVVTNYRGQNVSLSPVIRLLGQHIDGSTISETLSTTTSGWCTAPACRRYDSDRYQLDFVWPATLSPDELVNVKVELAVSDLSGLALDANAATVMRWQDGHWQDYEDAIGLAGDTGGADRSFRLLSTGEPPIYHGGIAPPPLQIGDALNYSFAADAFTDPENGALQYTLQADPGPLPTWLQLDSASRTLSGTPNAAGSYSFAVVAIDPAGNRSFAPVTITVSNRSSSGGGGGGGSWSVLSLALLLLSGLRRQRRIV
ncbi:hypothetical protein HPT27_07335 [Permianibacter sp. IMCC34836]|uniref:M14 family zinc carboxypeptidase n=1 Tax=Permianibacter fluminis TaxID=2738515 RepID=UPI001555295D|nr:M14 family zinc carboxypeptidase [Permianibacter fluminis]NQD36835.1 hypothetical protein [Permianibacter fluminis]